MRNCVIAKIRRLTRFGMRRYNPGMEYPEEIVRYYASRNDVYDEAAVYLGKEAEELRAPIKDIYRRLFSGKNVLEIACGSGYWTRVLAGVAASVLAVDINEEIIQQAMARCRGLSHVRFQIADAFTLEGVPYGFNAAVAIWWYSHVPRRRLPDFLSALNSRLSPGSTVLFIDQLPYEAADYFTDENGDTIANITLPGGQTFRVIKNFPTESEIRSALGKFTDDIWYNSRTEKGYWEVVYRTRGNSAAKAL